MELLRLIKKSLMRPTKRVGNAAPFLPDWLS
ncbi:hypothetical protein LQ236_000228 [Nitrospina gracilis]|nr:hypothetical protein [Nitrospina sp. Nb-3]